ncbi:MAG: isoprenylcysteine carboxylmethyltransferase family protein [Rhodothermales bacterium]
MTTQFLFLGIVLAVAAQRMLELRLSARNAAAIRAKGGYEVGAGHMGAMRLLHTAWFVAMLAEVFLLDRPFVPWLAVLAFAGLLAGQLLRYAAIRTLGPRWTASIMILPGAPPVASGLYRRIRHPNYVGVILEIAFVPFLHTAWLTALAFTVLNGLLLRVRIRTEEAALREANDYDAALGERPRFIPS